MILLNGDREAKVDTLQAVRKGWCVVVVEDQAFWADQVKHALEMKKT
jgi:hypothetical protein